MNELAPVGRVEQIKTLHAEIGGMVRATLDKAILVGQLLSEAKGELRHGEWLPWVEENLPFTDRTARSYMRLWEHRHELKSENVSDLSSAYKMLSEPKEDVGNFANVSTLEEPKEEKAGKEEWPLSHIDDARFIPPPGHALVGVYDAHDADGKGERFFIHPSSEHQGFYYVSYFGDTGLDGPDFIDGTKKPVRQDAIRFAINYSPHAPIENFKWESVPTQGWTYNQFLYDSDEDYVQQAILGRPKTWAEDDERKYQSLKDDIKNNGVLVAVSVDEYGYIIDGRKRVQACEELEIDYPLVVHGGLNEDEKEGLRQSLNGWMSPKPCRRHTRVTCKNVKEFEKLIRILCERAELNAKQANKEAKTKAIA